MNDLQFVESLKPYLFKPFSLGDKAKGWDCLNQLGDWARENGYEFPDEFDGWTWENYAQKWLQGDPLISGRHQGGTDVFRRFLMNLGDPVDPNYMLPGDIIVLETKGIVSAVQYLGSNKIKAVPKEMGTVVLPMSFFKPAIKSIRRLRKK
jgi:hypothetical protein